MSLTPKQQRVLDYINDFTATRGYAPSQAEIAKRFRFTSLGTVQNYLKALEAKGYLFRQKHLSRSIHVAEIRCNAVRIPLSGRVAAGSPIEAIEQRQTIDVPSALLKGGINFALEVKGDSMIEEGIRDGDVVIVRKQATAENGQIVIALLEEEATVKKFYRRKDGVELRPAHPSLEPILLRADQELKILGVVVGLIRKYG